MPVADSTNPCGLADDLTRWLFACAARYSEAPGGCHGLDHVERVHRMALLIGARMDANPRVLGAAAILHDIGRPEETRQQGRLCHARHGAALAREILSLLPFPPAEVEAIVHCIASHRYRGDAPPESLEAKILFDADKLDSIGATGIGRAFLFAGQIGARLHNPGLDHGATDAYSLEDTAYREYRVKLRLVRERMLTPLGRRLAEDRHRFMETFFARLTAETHPDIGAGHRP